MNKKILYYFIAIMVLGSIPSTIYVLHNKTSPLSQAHVCTQEAKICPDGTSVGRMGNNCEFALCPTANITSTSSIEINTGTSSVVATTSSFTQIVPETKTTPTVKPPNNNVVSKVSSFVSSIINTVVAPFNNTPSIVIYTDPTITPSTYISSSSTSVYKPVQPENFAGEKFIVKDGNIVTSDNKLVYNIPSTVIESVSNPSPGWTNTIINVVQVGTVAPVLPDNAIPIADLPGKYYLSQNSFGNLENCEFSNKIFILDTVANTATLIYEENNTTLTRDDPRACNSEIFLLTTEGNELILKYHTISTNTLCDSAWSEPEKTFYLDVTKLRTDGMRKYNIPENLSNGAEAEEEACRLNL